MTNLKSIRNIFRLMIITSLFSACSENEDIPVTESTLTEEEAVIMVEESLQASSGGMVETTQSYALELSDNPSLENICNTPQEKVFAFNYEEVLITANYNMHWEYELSCNNFNIAQSISFQSSSSGVFSSERMNSNDKSSGSFQVTGLEPLNNEYMFNGNYYREGEQSLITNFNSRSVSSTLNINLNELAVDKGTNRIISGTGNLILSGTTEQTGSFSFEGEIEFLGNGQAILKINGTVYEIDIN